MKSQFIFKKDLNDFLGTLSVDNDIYYLADNDAYKKYSANGPSIDISIDNVRANLPLRSFFFNHNEKLDTASLNLEKKTIIFGVKACDLNALKIIKEVYLGGVCTDPFVENKLANTLIFASDCPTPKDTCFCTFIGGNPFAQAYENKSFDLNFSPVDDGYVVDVISVVAEEIIAQAQAFFRDAVDTELSKREEMRDSAVKTLDRINVNYKSIKDIDFKGLAGRKYLSESWKEYCKTCVQCTGCNNICPSCYCFYLTEANAKYRYWDACHYTTHGKETGTSAN